MSAKNSTQAYEVGMGMFGTQKPGSREVVMGVYTLAGYGKPRMSVTVDTGFGEQSHVWLRFSQESEALQAHMLGHGWHYSAKNRQGYHRADDAQAQAFVKTMLDKASRVEPSALVKAEAPKTTTAEAPATQAPKTGKKGGKGGIKSQVATQAGTVAPAQEVGNPLGATATPKAEPTVAEMTQDELLLKLEQQARKARVAAEWCELLVAELKTRK